MKDPMQRTLFLNGVEVQGEAAIWKAIARHAYRPLPSFYRPKDRWQIHARKMAPPVVKHPCMTQTTASA